MNLQTRRYFEENLKPLADAIARLDIDQPTRERVADALADAIGPVRVTTQSGPVSHEDLRVLFRLLASDPLSPCVGPDGTGCPHGREIRIAMHNRHAPDGRSAEWAEHPPLVACVECGPAALSAFRHRAQVVRNT